MSNNHLSGFRKGFHPGYTKIIGLDDVSYNVGMEFGILVVSRHEKSFFVSQEKDLETQLVVLEGEGVVRVGDDLYEVSRKNVFDENPWVFDIPAGVRYFVYAPKTRRLEIAVIKAQNTNSFKPIVLRPEDVPVEERGKGIAGGAMHRQVKALFGDPMARDFARPQESNLVVGEAINLPGKWSSYPPHYHPQSEVYYYRFDKSQGFGVSVLNNEAYVVQTHDAMKITNCVGHVQTSAPGYAMWYLWFIRQINGNRYEGDPPFTYFPEHEWVLDRKAKIWKPSKN